MRLRAMCILALLVTTATARPATAVESSVTLQWLGHASFLIKLSEGVRIVTDPFPAGLGYPLAHPVAEIVLVSHEHFDHSAVGEVRGGPRIIRFGGRSGAATARGIAFKGIEALHYLSEGDANRGTVTLFTFSVDGIRFCHLGDLGRALTPEQVKSIGPVDVLMIPTGGAFTIGPAEATQVIAPLRPKVVIPMHYRTAGTPPGLSRLAPLQAFLNGRANVKRIQGDSARLTRAGLPAKTTIYAFMKYSQ